MDRYIDPKTAIQTAKLVSFPSAFALAGYSLCIVQATLPALYDHRPQVTTPVFKSIWTSAGSIIPTLTLLSGSASAYLAYAIPAQRREFTIAAATIFATVPWSAWTIMPRVQRLIAISEDKAKVEKSEQSLEHRQLLVLTARRKYIMVVMQLVSAVVGLRAIVNA